MSANSTTSRSSQTPRHTRNQRTLGLIRSRGHPRVHEDLREQHERVSRKRVVRLMQEEGLVARLRKRFKCTTMSAHDQPAHGIVCSMTRRGNCHDNA